MLKKFKKFSILLLTSMFLFSSVEANWITKKSDKSKEVIKEEKKQKSKWIKLKKKEIKKNKEDYKKKEKNISKEVKNWITKRVKKDKFIDINSLPNSQIYFSAQASDGRIFYGFINDDKKSDKINFQGSSIYKISKGKAYIQNNKSICNIATERGIIANTIIGFVSGECSDKTKFTGQYSQKNKSGSAETDQKIKINFSFNENLKSTKTEIAKLNKKNNFPLKSTPKDSPEINLNPTGKYYALLIGNSNYVKWSSLKSPVNDVNEIKKVLEKQYNFEKVISVINGTRKDIFKAITELTKITTDKDYVLIYYSGHGDIRSTQSYWIPVDGAKNYDPTEWINIRDIEVYLENEISAHHLVVMVDSCYFAVASKGQTKIDIKNKTMAYSKLLDRRARIILSSGSNEPVEDTVNKHSKFASSFIQSLKNNEKAIRLTEITENIFIDHAGSRQMPYHARVMAWGHGGGDFIFISKK
jgi:hypothetical protein